jgi:hypothetical protein
VDIDRGEREILTVAWTAVRATVFLIILDENLAYSLCGSHRVGNDGLCDTPGVSRDWGANLCANPSVHCETLREMRFAALWTPSVVAYAGDVAPEQWTNSTAR